MLICTVYKPVEGIHSDRCHSYCSWLSNNVVRQSFDGRSTEEWEVDKPFLFLLRYLIYCKKNHRYYFRWSQSWPLYSLMICQRQIVATKRATGLLGFFCNGCCVCHNICGTIEIINNKTKLILDIENVISTDIIYIYYYIHVYLKVLDNGVNWLNIYIYIYSSLRINAHEKFIFISLCIVCLLFEKM